ncbi:MAG: hypothetical protein A2096_07540 [Spirochaetes bacterium GWF1_41_5]|nr:MAG: hypothetical protein A2096_07540 [Spirochaetes bacterium GWF1_41_5]HBE01937.1 hypothetical protein [Spirochaetia bacterium]
MEETREEIIPSAVKEVIPPPDYTQPVYTKERDEIASSLGFFDVDYRLWHEICVYSAEKIKNAIIDFEKLSDYVLELGISGLTIGGNVRAKLRQFFSNLAARDYCIIRSLAADQKTPNIIVLKNKGQRVSSLLYSDLREFLRNYYRTTAQIGENNHFAGTADLTRHLNLKPEENIDNLLNTLRLNELGIRHSESPDGCNLFRLDFNEKGIEPFDILIYYENDFNGFFKKIILDCISRHYNEALINSVSREYEKRYKKKESAGISSPEQNFKKMFEQMYFIGTPEGPDLKNENCYKWAFVLKETLLFTLLNKSDRLYYVFQAACLLYYYLFNVFLESTNQDLHEKNKKSDVKALFNQLLLNPKERDESGRTLYRTVSMDEIRQFRDFSRKQTIGEKYSAEEIRSMMGLMSEVQEANSIGFEVLRIDRDSIPEYCHRWRLIDVFSAEIIREGARLQKKLEILWSQNPKKIPKRSQLKITEDDLSGYFKRLFSIIDTIRKSNGMEILVDTLFPSKFDYEEYGLQNSNLVLNSYSPREKAEKIKIFIDDVLYQNRQFLLKEFADIFGLDYASMKQNAKAASRRIKKRGKKSGLFEGFFDAADDSSNPLLGIIFWFFGALGSIFSFGRKKLSSVTRRLGELNEADALLYELRSLHEPKKISIFLEKYQNHPDYEYLYSMAQKQLQEIKNRKHSAVHTAVVKPKASSHSRSHKQTLKEIAPIANNPEELEKMIGALHEQWNMKIGAARDSLRREIDYIITKISGRFDINEFRQTNSAKFAENIYNNNSIFKTVKNEKALRQYIYYRAVEIKLQQP